MGDRRMISRKIVESARFLKMPATSQNLYFHLIVNADDDGVVEAYRVINMCNANEDDLKVLVGKQFVTVLNEDLVSYIEDWQEQNKLRADRKTDSIYQELLLERKPELQLLEKKERSDTKKAKNKAGSSVDGPVTAQGKVIEDKSNQNNLSQGNLSECNSIHLSIVDAKDGGMDEAYRELIAKNIGLESLLQLAAAKDGRYSDSETKMVNEIFDTICDVVCNPRETIKINNAEYSWKTVQSQFLKLTQTHVANILNRILATKDSIKNMYGYLVSCLYKESMSGTLYEQAELHDDLLNFYRGQPYAV